MHFIYSEIPLRNSKDTLNILFLNNHAASITLEPRYKKVEYNETLF